MSFDPEVNQGGGEWAEAEAMIEKVRGLLHESGLLHRALHNYFREREGQVVRLSGVAEHFQTEAGYRESYRELTNGASPLHLVEDQEVKLLKVWVEGVAVDTGEAEKPILLYRTINFGSEPEAEYPDGLKA